MPTSTALLPIAQFTPDAPDFPPTGSRNISGVYPRTPVSYGPIATPTPSYNALPSRCQGACAYRSKLGNISTFAGSANDLWHLSRGDAVWQNVSSSPGAYNIDPDLQWQFTYFNGDVIATNFTDPPQYFRTDSSTLFSDLGGLGRIMSPPYAKYVATVKNAFVVFANTYDPANGNRPQRVWWSAAGNDQAWPTPGSAQAAQFQSGATDLLGDGGNIQAIIPGLTNCDALILQEYAVRQMIYAGPPAVFDFLPLQAGRGTAAPYACVGLGGVCYYPGQDGFYANDGLNSTPIGANRVDKWFFGDPVAGIVGKARLDSLDRMIALSDPLNKLIWWFFVSVASLDGNPDLALIYNWQIDRWAMAAISCETAVRLLSLGYTLDELYTILGYSLDNLPAPLDSPRWQGGILQIGLFDTQHRLNYLDGPLMAATVESIELEPQPGRRTFVSNTRPLVDGGMPSVAIGHRERTEDAVTYGTAVPLNSMGFCPQRRSGRYVRALSIIPTPPPDAKPWTNFSGIELTTVIQGTR